MEELFGEITEEQDDQPDYSVSFTDQGLAGVELTPAAFNAGEPFVIAFIDMHMPPGIDGLETDKRLRAIDKKIQIIVNANMAPKTLISVYMRPLKKRCWYLVTT